MGNNSAVSGLVASTKSYFTQIIEAVAILIIGFTLGIIAQKVAYRILKELTLNKIMSKVGVTYNLEKIVSNIISYVIYLFFIVIFLNHLGITSIVLYLIMGAILMLLILTFLVGLKDIIPNFVAWLLIQRRGKLKEGRRVEVREIVGVVEHVGFLETEIKTEGGDILYVPNSLFLKSKFKLKKNFD